MKKGGEIWDKNERLGMKEGPRDWGLSCPNPKGVRTTTGLEARCMKEEGSALAHFTVVHLQCKLRISFHS